jgi:hypothetical protein
LRQRLRQLRILVQPFPTCFRSRPFDHTPVPGVCFHQSIVDSVDRLFFVGYQQSHDTLQARWFLASVHFSNPVSNPPQRSSSQRQYVPVPLWHTLAQICDNQGHPSHFYLKAAPNQPKQETPPPSSQASILCLSPKGFSLFFSPKSGKSELIILATGSSDVPRIFIAF